MTESRNLVGELILTWREHSSEGDWAWVAAWVHRDVVAQGPTEQEAVRRLMTTIAIMWMLQEADGAEPPPVPSPELVERWRALHEKEHESCQIQ